MNRTPYSAGIKPLFTWLLALSFLAHLGTLGCGMEPLDSAACTLEAMDAPAPLTLEAVTEVHRLDPLKGTFEAVDVEALAVGDTFHTQDHLFRLTAEHEVELVAEVTMAALEKTHARYESGAGDFPTATDVVWLLDADAGGQGARHAPVSALAGGDLFAFGNKVFRVEARDGDALRLTETGLALRSILDTSIRPDKPIWEVSLEHTSGSVQVIEATGNHPFYVPALDEYVQVEQLREGFSVLGAQGELVSVVGVQPTDRFEDVYNLTIDGIHNYFVAAEGGRFDAAVLAHNTSPCAESPKKIVVVSRLGPSNPHPNMHGFSARNVNEVGGLYNCASCAVAMDRTLAGRPTRAGKSGLTNTKAVEKAVGGSFKKGLSAVDIVNQMTAAERGARGIVFGKRGPGVPGHFFNVVNQKGTVRFIDAQKGTAADLNNGYKQFWLLRTN